MTDPAAAGRVPVFCNIQVCMYADVIRNFLTIDESFAECVRIFMQNYANDAFPARR